MSKADIERFIADLKSNPDLLTEVKENAGGLASVVDFAKGKGYDITAAEAKAYISEQAGQELSDEQIDMVAGGKAGAGSQPSITQATLQAYAVEVVQAATSESTQTQIQVVLDGGVLVTTVA